jgi:hypothetical protein
MEKTECSETSAYKIQTPGNYLEENRQHSEKGESLKSRKTKICSQQAIKTKSGTKVWMQTTQKTHLEAERWWLRFTTVYTAVEFW